MPWRLGQYVGGTFGGGGVVQNRESPDLRSSEVGFFAIWYHTPATVHTF